MSSVITRQSFSLYMLLANGEIDWSYWTHHVLAIASESTYWGLTLWRHSWDWKEKKIDSYPGKKTMHEIDIIWKMSNIGKRGEEYAWKCWRSFTGEIFNQILLKKYELDVYQTLNIHRAPKISKWSEKWEQRWKPANCQLCSQNIEKKMWLVCVRDERNTQDLWLEEIAMLISHQAPR